MKSNFHSSTKNQWVSDYYCKLCSTNPH